MKKTIQSLVRHVLLFVAILVSFTRCGDDTPEIIEINPAFGEYISAFTSGVISKESTIRIRLIESNPNFSDNGEPLDDDLFDFSPSIDGEAYWIDERLSLIHI